jgi:hypothetical protein
MSNLTRVVPLLVIQHQRVSSSTSLAVIRGRYHKLLPIKVVTPTCMPLFHSSQKWEMIQSNEVIAPLSLQAYLHPSLVKPSSTHNLQPQTVKAGVSCLHISLSMTLRLLSCLEYDVLLLQPP